MIGRIVVVPWPGLAVSYPEPIPSHVAYLLRYLDFRVAAWCGGVDGRGDKVHMHSEGGLSWSAEHHERYFSPL